MKLRNILIILMISQIVNHVVVFANGRSVGISEEDVKFSCTCIDKNGNEYQIDKLSIETNEKDLLNKLSAKEGIASVNLSLTKLDQIEFDEIGTENNKDGYLKATVMFNYGNIVKEYFIFVGTNENSVYLKGINENSIDISIALKDCKKVLFKGFSKDYQELPPRSHEAKH
ncbi:MAG: hypothetical protein ACYSTS_05315 [Planctomycetota bacterium]|jgi:hypothetical protein